MPCGVTGFAEGRIGASLLAAIAEARALPDDALPAALASRDGPRPSPALVSTCRSPACRQVRAASRRPEAGRLQRGHRPTGQRGRTRPARAAWLAPRSIWRRCTGAQAGPHRAWRRGKAHPPDRGVNLIAAYAATVLTVLSPIASPSRSTRCVMLSPANTPPPVASRNVQHVVHHELVSPPVPKTMKLRH